MRIQELATTAHEQQETLSINAADVAGRFQPEVYDMATPDAALRFEESYGSWLRLFKPGYYRDLRRLRSYLTTETELNYVQARDALRQIRRIATAKSWIEQHKEELSVALGQHYVGSHTDWSAVERSLTTMHELGATLNHRPFPALLTELLLGEGGNRIAFQRDALAFDNALATATTALTTLAQVMWWPTVLGENRQLQNIETVSTDTSYDADLTTTPLHDLVVWLRAWRHGMTPLWTAIDQLQSVRRTRATSIAELVQDLEHALAVQTTEIQVTNATSDLESKYGHLFTGMTTQWSVILDRLAWTGRVVEHFNETPPETFIEALAQGTSVNSKEQRCIAGHIDEVARCFQLLAPMFEDAVLRIGTDIAERVDLNTVADWARDKRRTLRRLEEWVDLHQAHQNVEAAGLNVFVDQLVREQPPRDDWCDIFLRQLYTLWLSWRYSEAPALAHFRTQHHEDTLREFRNLDQLHWQTAASRIAERLVRKRPVLTANVLPRSEPAILLKEASKRRRFRPLRKLFADLPNLLPTLKPCMLMSPLAVAQFLGDSAIAFDVVIFDEASQILPSDAIGAISRGRQVVVVGDQQQLPPTRFFAAEPQVADEESDEEVPESILDACMAAGMPSKPLLWHYRSRHEDLIAFSNHHFYDRRLITFPSSDSARRAVEFKFIEHGVYDRASTRVNRIEAKWIAHLVVEHVTQQSSRPPLGL